MSEDTKYVTDVVLPGESLRTFAERNGVDHRRIMDLNHDTLRDDAQARGFDSHTFLRPVPDENGGAIHEGRVSVRHEPDAHVFAWQVLKVREDDKEPDA